MARVVADDKEDLARAAGVVANEMRDVQPGDGVAGSGPGGRDAPVAAVDQAGRRVGQARGLRLRKRRGRPQAGSDQPGSVALVIAQPQDVDVVGLRRRLDLEVDRLADVDAHRRREALNGAVADAVDLPVARWIARLAVLASHRVDHRRSAGTGSCSLAAGEDEWRHDRGRGKDEQRSPDAPIPRYRHPTPLVLRRLRPTGAVSTSDARVSHPGGVAQDQRANGDKTSMYHDDPRLRPAR